MHLTPRQKNSIPAWLAAALAFCLAVGVPLYMHNRYYNLVGAKLTLLLVCLSAFVLLLLATWPLHKVGQGLYGQRAMGGASTHSRRRPSATLLSVLLLLAATLASWAASPVKAFSFMGTPGRYNGLLLLLCLVGCYFALRRFMPAGWVRALVYALLAGYMAISALAVLNHFGADPLNAYTGMVPAERRDFISTLGNLNFLSAYLCLCVPVAVYGALTTVRRGPFVFYGLAALAGFAGLFAANSTSGFVGLGALWLLVICMRGFTLGQGVRAALLLALFCATAAAFGLAGGAQPAQSTQTAHALRGAAALLATPYMLIPALLLAGLALLGWLLCRRGNGPAASGAGRSAAGSTAFPFNAGDSATATNQPVDAPWQTRSPANIPLHLPGRIVAVCALTAATALVLAVNLGGAFAGSPLAAALTLGPAWGSWRGLAWQCLTQVYTQMFGPLQKLLGTGPDTVYLQLNPQFTWLLAPLNGATFDSAHNEYLHQLVSCGALGLAAWLGVLATHLRGLLRGGAPLARALQLGIAVYAVQAFFNIAMPTTLPLLWAMLALSAVCRAATCKGGVAANIPSAPKPCAPPRWVWLVALPIALGLLALTGAMAGGPAALAGHFAIYAYGTI